MPQSASDTRLRSAARFGAWLWSVLRPAPLHIGWPERARAVVGAASGLLLAASLAWVWPPAAGLPWLLVPLGASAVLVFALPASPLAQPWAVVGGNTVSALVGLLCVHWISWPPLAAALAVGGAIAAMLALRCLHPPGGAVALLTVVAGVVQWRFALAPVAQDSVWLVLAGCCINPLGGRRYPHPQAANPPSRHPAGMLPPSMASADFTEADLDAVLARYPQVLDVPRDDLQELLLQAGQQARQRCLQALRCRDIMTAQPHAVVFGTPLAEAWALLRQQRIKALPVTDRHGHVVGIVTQADFLRHAGLDLVLPGAGLGERLRNLIRATPGPSADKPEVVGQIMTRQVRVASQDRTLAELVPLFAQEGHHHLPIIGERNRLVGILTQTDVVAALAGERSAAGPSPRA